MHKLWLIGSLLLAPTALAAAPGCSPGLVWEDADGDGVRGPAERPLPGVLLSDGSTVVATDDSGRYSFALHDGRTVFLVKPATHQLPVRRDGSPDFWYHVQAAPGPTLAYGGIPTQPSSTCRDFGLLPRARAEAVQPLEVLLLADPQVKSVQDVDYYWRDIIQPLVGQHGAQLGLTLGDLVDDDLSLLPDVLRTTMLLGLPWLHVPGNHDMDLDAEHDADSLRTYRQHLGPDTYAREEAHATFIALDDVIHLPGQSPAYIGGLREDQFGFLQAYLPRVARDRLLVLAVHIPLFEEAGRDTFRDHDRERLFELLRPFAHLLVLSGHSHTQRHWYHAEGSGWQGGSPLHEYNVGAACGAYWSGVADDSGIPAATMADGTPNGYARLRIGPGADYALSWHPAREPGDPGIGLHLPKVLRQGAYPAWGVYANVYMGDERSLVEYRVDEGEWGPMRKVLQPDPALLVENTRDDLADGLRGFDRSPEAKPSQHLWRGALPTELEAGVHRVEVRARDRWRGTLRARASYRLERASP